MNNIYKTIARTEAMAAAQRDEMLEVMQEAYQRACENEDAESAAFYARKIRNKLLADSDKNMTFDRMGLSAPSGSTFTAWLSFLRTLGNVLGGAWARYRQALRDISEQEGFPFNIQFPEKPEE